LPDAAKANPGKSAAEFYTKTVVFIAICWQVNVFPAEKTAG